MTVTVTKGYFVTGTDTEIGKSFVTGSIGHSLYLADIPAKPRKPIASGCITQPDGSLLSEDAAFLKAAFHSNETLDQICPFLFKEAVSPRLAMEINNHFLNTNDLSQNCQLTAKTLTFVEGAGGFYSPLSSDGLNSDLAVKLGYPVILVVGDRLGCINHALLTLEAISNCGLETKAVIINHLHPRERFAQGLDTLTDVPIFECDYSPSSQPQQLSSTLIALLSSKS